jgi:predicted CoA-substrate-specific enzyme activase
MNEGEMIFAGLDIGSVSAKAVLWDPEAGETRATAYLPTGWEPNGAGQECLAQALAEASVAEGELGGLVVTGYGRNLWRRGGRTITEITCLAAGARQALPGAHTVFDVGGQDSKVLSLDATGQVSGFAVNDRCAAGTGRFLEMAAQRLGQSVVELGALALEAPEAVRLSSLCAVFAESEIVGLLAQGAPRDRIARGLCDGVAQQLLHLATGVVREPPVALVGGVARNPGVVAALERALGESVVVPDRPHLVVAWGAAVLAGEAAANRV